MKRFMLAAFATFLLTRFAEASSTFPVRVSFHFRYNGSLIETSYLTTIGRESGNVEISRFRYTHGRDGTSLMLPDGSLVILRPDWPPEWQDFETEKSYTSVARWFWLDARYPRQIVYGDGATKHVPTRAAPAPFSWLDITATIERLDDTYIYAALQADKVHDQDDKIEYSNLLGGSSNFHGTLFTGLDILPLRAPGQTKIEQVKNSPGWITLENCRFKPIQQGNAGMLSGLTRYADGVGLLRDGTDWSGDGGPRPGEPVVMYSTEKEVEAPKDGSFSVFPFRSLAINMVHSVKWDGVACRGIEPPVGAQDLLIQFSDGKLALIAPSDSIAVARN